MEERMINLKVFDANWLCRYLDWFRDGITLEQYCSNSMKKYGCYLTPALFEELRKYRFSRQGIGDRKKQDEEECFMDKEFGYNATSLLEQIDAWAAAGESRRNSPEIDYAQFRKEFTLLSSFYHSLPD